jgi:hypothetical protein
MTKDEALKLSLEALESCETGHITDGGNQWHDEKLVDKAITAIKQALAAPVQDEFDIRGMLASKLTCWNRLRETEANELVALVASLSQPAPPECQTEAEKTAYAFGWWKALESQREQRPIKTFHGGKPWPVQEPAPSIWTPSHWTEYERDIRNAALDEIAAKIALMPFGDTAASFAVWIKEQKT